MATLLIATLLSTISSIIVLRAYGLARMEAKQRDTQYQRAEREKAAAAKAHQQESTALVEAKRERDRAESSLYVAHMQLAQQDWQRGQIDRLYTLLDSHIPTAGQADHRGWEWYFHLSHCYGESLNRHYRGDIRRVDWSPLNDLIASAEGDGTITIWHAGTGDTVRTICHPPALHDLAISPDGTKLATSGLDIFNSLRVWSLDDGRMLLEQQLPEGATTLAWSPDGKTLATATNRQPGIVLWDIPSGKRKRTIEFTTSHPEFRRLDWHPNAHYLVIAASIGRGDTAFICDLGTGELSELSTNMDDYDVLDVAWNQDGSQLASSHYHGMIKIWKFEEGEASLLFGLPQPGVVPRIAWSPTSPLLAAACHTQQIVIWNVPDQTRIRQFRGHSGWIQDLAWSPQSRQLVSAGTWDRTCRIWELAEPSVERKIDQEVAVRTEIARIGPTGELLVFSKDRNLMRITDTGHFFPVSTPVVGDDFDHLLHAPSPHSDLLAVPQHQSV